MRKLFLLLGFIVFLIGQLTAQNRTISGTITDANGAPVTGASIVIKGSNRGTSTTVDGTFTISVPSNAKILIITAINFTSKEVNIQNKTDIGAISLDAANKNLQEVVVVAYGTQKKTNITGAVVTVSGAQVADKPYASPDKALQGSTAGLQASSSNGIPGSNTDIRIRGIGSITAGASPLWVIDGIIATTGDLTTNTTSANALSGLNPDDIESFSVLKDAAGTALYGSRGANGVIIVTTKRGKAGKTKVNFSTEIGRNSVAFANKRNRPLTTPEYHQLLITSIMNTDPTLTAADADALITDPVNGLGMAPDWANTNTNWLKQVTHTGQQQQYNLSLTGGNEKTQYYASAGYFNQDGTTIATYFKRYNGSVNVNSKINDKVTFSTGINGSFSNQLSPPGSAAYSSPVSGAFFIQPYYSPYNTDGSLRYNDPEGEFPAGSQFNPVAVAAFDRYTDAQMELRGFVSGEYQILPNLKFTSRYSGEYLDINEYSYWNPRYGDGYPLGLGQAFDRKIFNWTWTNQVNYKLNLNSDKDFYLDLLAATEANKTADNSLSASGNSFPSFPSTTTLTYLASAAAPTGASNLPSNKSVSSYLSQAVFNYKDRYILSGSFRRDGSSVFAEDHKWGNFYSIGGSWNINEEKFFTGVPVINLLKLRSSYGTAGNTNGFGYYSALSTYGYGVPYMGESGSAPNNVGNPNLTWEKNKAFNVGLDFGLWKDRFGGTVEYYKRTTSDLLVSVPLSPTSGFNSQLENVGSLYNQGFELTLTGKPIVTKDFTWTSTFNISHNKNRVTSLYNHAPISQNTRFNITEGHDIYEFYTRIWAGADPANGDPLWYTDATRKATTNVSTQVALSLTGKSASPKYYGGFTNTFAYKAFTLSAQLYYNFGNYIYSTWENYLQSDGAYLTVMNQLSNELNGWKKPGDITSVPKVVFGGNQNSNAPSTRYLYKGDYIRLRDVQFSYSLPKSVLDKAHISNLSIYLRGSNLLTFGTDKHLSVDPEVGANSISDFQVFNPKTVSAGVRIGF